MPVKYPEQSREIIRICEEAGLSFEEMASRVALRPESMRKIARGYQPCSDQLMQSFRNVAEIERIRRGEQNVSSSVQMNVSMKYPAADDPGGMVTNTNSLLEKITKDLREIAEAAPAKLREIEPIITTYRKTIRKRKTRM